jgi:hypothetical protein
MRFSSELPLQHANVNVRLALDHLLDVRHVRVLLVIEDCVDLFECQPFGLYPVQGLRRR